MHNAAARRPHPVDLLAAFVLDACSPSETATVDTHAVECPACAQEIDDLAAVMHGIATTHRTPPPAALRDRVLAAATRARPATGAPLDAYTIQVAAFGRLLSTLTDEQWNQPSGPYRTVHDLVGHMADSDRLVAAEIGVAKIGWRQQADGLIRVIADGRLLDRPVPLAGAPGIRKPLVEAVTQRAFETWIHADDLRGTLRLPPESPPPEHIDRIVRFGLALLPGAMDAAGRGHPGWVRLVLTGAGGGAHRVTLSSVKRATDDGPQAADIALSAETFCRLMAGRIAPAGAAVQIQGDRRAAADLITVAATLGCD